MADIFVSYSQDDKERVRPIVYALKEAGWSVWWDAEGAAGSILDEMVDRELKASKCVLVVWSQASVRSDWVLGEADEGRERRQLVPVAIDDIKPPRRFRQFNTVRLESWDGDKTTNDFRKLVAGMQAHVAAHPGDDRKTEDKEESSDSPTESPDTIGDQNTPSSKRRALWIGGGVTAVLLIVAGFTAWQWIGPGPSPPRPEIVSPEPDKNQGTAKTLQLTPDLGSSPRRSGTLVHDGIVPSGYSASGTILSDPSYIGVSGPKDFTTPDGRGTSKQRAFLTFPLQPLSSEMDIQTARLQIRIGGLSGQPVYQRVILVERVSIGGELDKADYAAGGVLVATEAVDRVRAPGIDVTQAVREAVREGADELTLRVRFELDYLDDYFNSSTGGLLTIEYLP